MKVLVVGKGGREHAIIWKIKQNPSIKEIYCIPGNGGISQLAICLNIKETDIKGIVDFAKKETIDLVVVAPDNPLVDGLVDALEKANIRAFGPHKKAAIIEGSKAFSKKLMKKYHIPTAKYEAFRDYHKAIEYLNHQSYPLVIKADGLALGKGVIIAENSEQAKNAIDQIMKLKIFGKAGNKIIIEEFLVGKEISILSFTDGKTIVPMVSSQDYKRALNNDQGLNTGGMGSISPSPNYNPEIADYCMKNIYLPTIEAMNKEKRTFKGVLYFGLIITEDGPKVLEYNARFGDPETQVILPRLQNDIIDIFNAIIDEKLDSINFNWDNKACACITIASGGYPQKYATGYKITGIEEALEDPNVIVFHAGTNFENNKYYTAGGRVLNIVANEATMEETINKAYVAVKKIKFENMYYRDDIGKK